MSLNNKNTNKANYVTDLVSRLMIMMVLITGLFGLTALPSAYARSLPPDNINIPTIKKSEVLILTASWCHYCTKMRQFLTNNKIKFTEYDIEQSALGYQLYRSLGGKGVPVIKIGEEVLYGYSPEKLKQTLNKNGYKLK